MIYTTRYDSPVGGILLAERNGALTGLWIDGQRCEPDPFGEGTRECTTPALAQAVNWLERYFAKERPQLSELRLAPVGSAFRQEVWKLLMDIPYGQVTTYGAIAGEMARRLGRKAMSAQAVGGAVGSNEISIIIPCHRVVGANGNLTGYGGGIAKKIALLTHEGVDMTKLFVPRHGTAL